MDNDQPHILILEDNDADAELMKRELRKAGLAFTSTWTPGKVPFLSALENSQPDLVLADYSVPGFDGLSALTAARQRFPDIPVVIVSGAIGEELAIETLKGGATDYVLKQRLDRLGPVTLRALQEANQIAERKRVENALRESDERLRLLIEGIHDYAIVMLDTRGYIASWNTGAERILGWTSEEAIGQHFSIFYPPQTEKSGTPRRFLELAAEGRHEDQIQHVRKDRSLFWADVVMCAIHDAAGHLRGYAKIMRDISERKQAEDALAQANADLQAFTERLQRSNRDLEDFAFIASHDLQEPLRKIKVFGQRLQDHAGDHLDAEETDFLERMISASQRMKTMIDELLAYSRVTTKAQPFERVDLNAVVREVISDLEIQVELTQGQVIIGEIPCIEADRYQMHQLFLNLIGNGLKFHRLDLPPVVQVSARILEPQHTKATGRLGSMVEILIEDNGIGFDISQLERIFKPFERLHGKSEYKGFGMGLAICRKIVEHHSGKITAKSQPGFGSSFIIDLPYQESDKLLNEKTII